MPGPLDGDSHSLDHPGIDSPPTADDRPSVRGIRSTRSPATSHGTSAIFMPRSPGNGGESGVPERMAGPARSGFDRAEEVVGSDGTQRGSDASTGGGDPGEVTGPVACRMQGVARRACGMAVMGLGCSALLGWVTGHRVLAAVHPDYIPMAPNTAVSFLLLGLGVCVLPRASERFWGRLIAGSGGAFVTLICAARLSEYATGYDLAVDRLILRVPSESFGLAPVGKMAFFTAIALLISGTAMFLLALPGRLRFRANVAGILGSLVVATGSVFGLGYVFDAPLHYNDSTIPMAILTAIGFVLLGSGLVAASGPDALPLRPLLGPSIQSRLLRVFLPLVLGTVFFVNWSTHLVIRYAGSTFLAIASASVVVGAFLIASVVCARIARQVGEHLECAEEALRRAHDELEDQVARRTWELSLANARLSELATTDGLTGLKNIRHFREALGTAFSLASRRGRALSLLLLDVDHFKSYNDTFGHPAGDAALRAVADVLRGNVRDHDVVARYGGEEFVVLLMEADEDASRRLAGRLRAAIESAEWRLRPVTASVGIATLTPGTPDSSTLIAEVDLALYHSKHSGRNRVTHYDDMAAAELQMANSSGPTVSRDASS